MVGDVAMYVAYPWTLDLEVSLFRPPNRILEFCFVAQEFLGPLITGYEPPPGVGVSL